MTSVMPSVTTSIPTAAALGFLVLAALVAYAATRPDAFRVARSLAIAAPAERLFPLINDLRAMSGWNPYALRDPGATGAYSGPPSGRGAVHTFAGPKSGTGRIEIIEAVAPRAVTMRLTMQKPFAADNTVRFTLEPNGAATTVTWAMEGRSHLIGKLIGLVVDCDAMVGKDFAQGLANLRALVETQTARPQAVAGADEAIAAR